MKTVIICLLSSLLLAPVAARAQAMVGDGLRGEYYQGLNFDRQEGSRRDPRLDFEWQGQPPLRGMLADYFTVRWTGWLVPPVTGRYVLRLTVDDAVRLWLNDKQLVDEWRGQPLGYYEATVDLEAGHSYRLRLDYAQYSLESRMQLAWERPRRAEALRSWRNLWNVSEKTKPTNRQREVIPTRYLFSRLPAPPAPPRPMSPVALNGVLVAAPTVPVATPRPPTKPAAPVAPRPLAPVSPPPIASLRTRPAASRLAATPPRPLAARQQPVAARLRLAAPPPQLATALPRPGVPRLAALVPSRLAAVPGRPPADTLAAQLAKGQSVTWRALYFEQGRATLPPPVQASLDTLAELLARHPALRLEVQGHTDNQGDSTLNRQLSRQRAEAVCQYLTAHGVAAGRLRPLGLGGTRPVADNRRPAQRPRNRRVVLRPLP